MTLAERDFRSPPRWAAMLLLLGLSLSLRGYQSREGDQAYRLPLLLHQQDPAIYAADPFVGAVEQYNPHVGYLAAIQLVSLPLGLSAGLFALYVASFALTFVGLDRLSRLTWPGLGPSVGSATVILAMLAQAGNIGTNHLFGPMLLDRLLAHGLCWVALSLLVERLERGIPPTIALLGLASFLHPALGLQWTMLLIASWVVWGIVPEARPAGQGMLRRLIPGLFLALGGVPSILLMSSQKGDLFSGLDPGEFRIWTALVQSPQHLVPSLWRLPQWLAWFAFLGLGALGTLRLRWGACGSGLVDPSPPHGRPAALRLGLVLMVALMGLAIAWLAIEPIGDFRVMLFQPFRMATVARGLCLVLVSGHLVGLLRTGQPIGRMRVMVVAVGLAASDWACVVAVAAEIAAALPRPARGGRVSTTAFLLTLAGGLAFLARHDTASGHLPLLAAVGAAAFGAILSQWSAPERRGWTQARLVTAMTLAWLVPVGAVLAPSLDERARDGRGFLGGWATHCRIREVPRDDIERLAVWARENTPKNARFVGPPGPKTFRLWSRRNLAFNRAASPYHAAGLADWATRFREHVAFQGPPEAFAREYLRGRQALESGYDRMPADRLASLVRQQGATYALTRAGKLDSRSAKGSLVLVRAEGRYSLYQVDPDASALAMHTAGQTRTTPVDDRDLRPLSQAPADSALSR